MSSTSLVSQPTGLALAAELERSGALTATALRLRDLSMGQWEALGGMIGTMHSSLTWWVGDWVLYGEQAFGEEHSQSLDAVGLASETIRQYTWLCERISPERRRAQLSLGVHRLIAKLEPEEQEHWLALAEENNWSRSALAQALAEEAGTAESVVVEPLPTVTNLEMVVEVAKAIFRDMRQAADPAYLEVPREMITRLRAALGLEE